MIRMQKAGQAQPMQTVTVLLTIDTCRIPLPRNSITDQFRPSMDEILSMKRGRSSLQSMKRGPQLISFRASDVLPRYLKLPHEFPGLQYLHSRQSLSKPAP